MTEKEFSDKLLILKAPLYRFALSLTRNKVEADDLLQETYLSALFNRGKFIGHLNLKAWVFTIMKNNFINSYRKKQKSNIYGNEWNHAKYKIYIFRLLLLRSIRFNPIDCIYWHEPS